MTFSEGVVIVSGLVIGYWLISAFLPSRHDDDTNAPPDTMDGLPPGAERDAAPNARPEPAPPTNVTREM